MFAVIKGLCVAEACRVFDTVPGYGMQTRLKSMGWNFRTINGPGYAEHSIIHPDGKPLAFEGAPGYVSGGDGRDDGGIILSHHKRQYDARWNEFKHACMSAR